MKKINYIVLVEQSLASPLGAGLAAQIAKQGSSGQGVGPTAHGGSAVRFLRHGVLRKRAGEVIGVNMHCFEVMGRRGTHRGGCFTAMAVESRGAPVRGRPTVASG
jgi:hypothetical protein